MKIVYKPALLILLATSCANKQKVIIKQETSKEVKKDYLRKLRDLPVGSIATFNGDNGDSVVFYEQPETREYREQLFSKNRLFMVYNIYDRKTKKLKQQTNFYSYIKQKSSIFDSKGKLVQTEDFDSKYRISVNELINRMKRDLNIDLLDSTPNRRVNRYFDDKLSDTFYVIHIPKDYMLIREIIINANTGTVVSDKNTTISE